MRPVQDRYNARCIICANLRALYPHSRSLGELYKGS